MQSRLNRSSSASSRWFEVDMMLERERVLPPAPTLTSCESKRFIVTADLPSPHFPYDRRPDGFRELKQPSPWWICRGLSDQTNTADFHTTAWRFIKFRGLKEHLRINYFTWLTHDMHGTQPHRQSCETEPESVFPEASRSLEAPFWIAPWNSNLRMVLNLSELFLSVRQASGFSFFSEGRVYCIIFNNQDLRMSAPFFTIFSIP